MRPHIDSAREAIREGRDAIDILYRMAERVGPRKAEAAREIAETYRSSFRIETQLVRLVEDYASVLSELAQRPDTVSDSRIDEAIEIFSSKLPGLTERRMALNEKRRRLIVKAFQR
jgi:Holliday junction resolvasome RuvABC ATP-dependent DNA helicase subunit